MPKSQIRLAHLLAFSLCSTNKHMILRSSHQRKQTRTRHDGSLFATHQQGSRLFSCNFLQYDVATMRTQAGAWSGVGICCLASRFLLDRTRHLVPLYRPNLYCFAYMHRSEAYYATAAFTTCPGLFNERRDCFFFLLSTIPVRERELPGLKEW